MKKLVLSILCCVPLAAMLFAAGTGHAREGGRTGYSAAVAPVHQFRTDLDQGGSFTMSGVLLHSSVTHPVSGNVDVGLGLTYAYQDYRFRNPVFTGGVEPWSEIHHIQGSAVYVRTLDDDWQVRLSPSIRFSGESGASTEDALAWGGFLSVSRAFHPGLVLGAGIAYSDDIDRRSVLPVVIVRWDITDRLRLANSPGTSPAGPAGMELSCRVEDDWALGVGVAWRSNRFRLDRHGFSSGGVARSRGIPVWVRASRSLTDRIGLDVYGGLLFSGNLRVDDVHGRRIADSGHSRAAFLSVALSARF
ncbi:MAG: DUF6268 family outer membrane beta-barrel protein [Syntrophales bacterium]|nr:DUF6268 family outer membrane beta-barrel protein [Syntrophales bacterium]